MNTNAIFFTNAHMALAHRQALKTGLTRVEISYHAADLSGQELLLDDMYVNSTSYGLDCVQRALRETENVTWQIGLPEILSTFDLAAKANQLLVVQPTVAALIYA